MIVPLLATTLVSTVIAVIMSVVAWRISREDRRRSDARVATLAAEIHGVHAGAVDVRGASAQSRWGFALIAGAIAIAVTAALAVVFSGEWGVGFRATPPGNLAPLELVALEDTRDGQALTVRGVLLNPPSGAEVDGLIAVVFGFGRDGELLASGRSAVASGRLLPGVKSSFTVTVAGASGVVRYRVSFRTDDRVVPHADRRAKS